MRVQDFDPTGIIGTLSYIDLVGRDEKDAEKHLLQEIEFRIKGKRRKPAEKPQFSKIKKTKNSVPTRPRPQFEPITTAKNIQRSNDSERV